MTTRDSQAAYDRDRLLGSLGIDDHLRQFIVDYERRSKGRCRCGHAHWRHDRVDYRGLHVGCVESIEGKKCECDRFIASKVVSL